MKLKQALLPLVIAGLVTACIGGKRTTPSEESSSLKAAFGNKSHRCGVEPTASLRRRHCCHCHCQTSLQLYRRGELHEVRGHPSGGKPV